MKSMKKQLLRAAGLFATGYVLNKGLSYQDKKKVREYGTKIPVNFQMMNVLVTGRGERTFVLLPDYMTPAPVLDYTPLTDELSKNNQVVVIEPFGYGLSDSTTKERTLYNVSEEIHNALQNLGIKKYILVSRGTSNIYLLDYMNRFQEEIEGFVGLDVSLPRELPLHYNQANKQFDTFGHSVGFYRLALQVKPELLVPPAYDDRYTEEIREEIRMIGISRMGSRSRRDEKEHMKENFEEAMKLDIPKEIPVLFFVTGKKGDWQFVETSLLMGQRDRGSIQLLKGEKPAHWYKSKTIRKEIESFFNEE